MKLLLAIWRYELKLQMRSIRFRLAALGYVILGSVPPLVVYFVVRGNVGEELGDVSYLAQTLQTQPYLTALLTVLVAGHRSGVGAMRENWPVLYAAPVSNVGFLFRRWLALLALILPLTLVPLVVSLGAAVAAGHSDIDAVTWLGAWSVRILPLAVALSAYWLAWVTVTGGELAALITSFVGFPIILGFVNRALYFLRLTLEDHMEWLGYRDLFFWLLWNLSGHGSENEFRPGYAATEAPYDLALAASWILPRGALLVGLAALGLGLASSFLRRTRRDLPPRPVPPKHQLRTFLEKLNRWREAYAPDGGLSWRERLPAFCGLLVLGLCVSGWIGRQQHYKDLATQRYQAERQRDFEPMPTTIEPTSWSVKGHLEASGEVRLTATSRFAHRGEVPHAELTFSLNPHLVIESLQIAGRQVTRQRAWDRLQLTLEPALAPGEEVEIEVELGGVPINVDFRFGRGRPGQSFIGQYQQQANARFATDVRDVSRSWSRRAVSPRRILLGAADLGPLPRYTAYTLVRSEESYHLQVPPEIQSSITEVELDLTVPAGTVLANSCGHTSRAEEGRARLASRCRTSVSGLQVVGGRWVTLGGSTEGTPGEVTFAALEQHREAAARHYETLSLVASLSNKAWPGMPGIEGLVAVEWSPEFDLDLRRGLDRFWGIEPDLHGRLLLIPERLVIDERPLRPESLVAQLLTRDLIARRDLEPGQQLFFHNFFRALMVRRMGLGKGNGATVSGKPWVAQAMSVPILTAAEGMGFVWRYRLPAVLVEMEARVGAGAFYEGIESFLEVDDGTAGTVEELLATLERHGGVSLAGMYRDFFKGKAVPVLRLQDVSSTRQRGGFRVHGQVLNTGTGESVCPVIVRTETHEIKLHVTVPSAGAVEFETQTEVRPHTVLLDPEKTCYRFLLTTSPTLERANLLDQR